MKTYCRGDVCRANIANVFNTALATPRSRFLADDTHVVVQCEVRDYEVRFGRTSQSIIRLWLRWTDKDTPTDDGGIR